MKLEARQLKVLVKGVLQPVLALDHCLIPPGEKLIITGQSGTGKTTLLHLFAGLLLPTQGEVLLDGVATARLKDNERTTLRRLSMGLVFQRLNLVEHLTAFENILLSAGRGTAAENKAMAALDELSMEHKAGTLVARLSLGEQQRVAVARALVNKPDLLLCDEPTSSLDNVNTQAVAGALLKAHQQGATLVVATHDERLLPLFENRLHLQKEAHP